MQVRPLRPLIFSRKVQLTWQLYLKISIIPTVSLIFYIVLVSIAFYPIDMDMQYANKNLSPILNDPGEDDVGLTVIVSLYKVSFIRMLSGL